MPVMPSYMLKPLSFFLLGLLTSVFHEAFLPLGVISVLYLPLLGSVLFLTLISVFLASIFPKSSMRPSKNIIQYFLVLGVSFTFFYSCIAFSKNLFHLHTIKVFLAPWLILSNFTINWCFLLDSLSCTMLVIVTFISTLVHIYSTAYMEGDPHKTRFMFYLSIFTVFMMILITADNFLQMFVGWEGVGLSSFLLINFWFTRIQANKAAIKAMLVNRVGDFFILLGLFSIYSVFNSLDYDTIFILAPLALDYKFFIFDIEISAIDSICLFLFLGAMGKSAQLGLHTWLPDAMEGPTPVSALIHAATMVTAGVFLLARASFLFELSPLVLNLIMFIGASTAFFASTTGLFQNDMKKVIAYSTCSQLGYMIFACGLSSYDVGMFHLSNHAFFKALLFLGAGSVIHAVSDEQDMRKMGGLKNLLPFSYSVMLIGSLALIGFPFLAGFYSKDTILEIAYSKYTTLGHFCYALGTMAAFFTAFYSTRLLFLVFLAKPNGNRVIIINAHEGPLSMTIPLFLLALLSIFIGFVTKELFIGFGTNFWNNAIFILLTNYVIVDIEFIISLFKNLPLFLTVLGCVAAYSLYSNNLTNYYKIKSTSLYIQFYNFFNKKWYFDKLYNINLSQSILELGYRFTYQDLDRGVFELFGPTGVNRVLNVTIKNITRLNSGSLFQIQFYLVLVLVFCFLICFFSSSIITHLLLLITVLMAVLSFN